MTASTRRPASIQIFSAIYLAAPAAVLVQAGIVNMVPLAGPGGILSRLGLFDWATLALYPVSAAAIFSVRRPGWWIFIACSVALLAQNVAALVLNPLVSPLSVLVFDAALIAAAGAFFRRHVIAPYFNPRLRPWASPPRYGVDLRGFLEKGGRRHEVRISDLSRGGAFVLDLPIAPGAAAAGPAEKGAAKNRLFRKPSAGDVLDLVLDGSSIALRVQARVVRTSLAAEGRMGYGLMFQGAAAEARAELDRLAEAAEASFRPALRFRQPRRGEHRASARFPLQPEVNLYADGRAAAVGLRDLSRGGVAVYPLPGSGALIGSAGDEVALEVEPKGRGPVLLRGRFAWTSPNGTGSAGIRFTRAGGAVKPVVAAYLKFLRLIRAEPRKMDGETYGRVLEETLERCPYRLVAGMRRALR